MITELFCSHILHIKKAFFIQEVSGVCSTLFLDTDELKMALQARKVSETFGKRASSEVFIKLILGENHEGFCRGKLPTGRHAQAWILMKVAVADICSIALNLCYVQYVDFILNPGCSAWEGR